MNSTHPLSRILVGSIDEVSDHISLEKYHELPGAGLQASIGNDSYKLGSLEFVTQNGTKNNAQDSATQVFVSKNAQLIGRFRIENKYREGIGSLVSQLKSRFSFSILTGDNKMEERRLKTIFGDAAHYRFGQSPQDKLDYIRQLQQNGNKVLMIGDGLNDAGALQQSDVGISVTDDTTHFTPASDGIMTSSSLHLLPDFLNFAGTAHRIVIAAFSISFIYNVVGISIALAGYLTPLIAAILMPLSSISVVVFATTVTNMMARIKKLI